MYLKIELNNSTNNKKKRFIFNAKKAETRRAYSDIRTISCELVIRTVRWLEWLSGGRVKILQIGSFSFGWTEGQGLDNDGLHRLDERDGVGHNIVPLGVGPGALATLLPVSQALVAPRHTQRGTSSCKIGLL